MNGEDVIYIISAPYMYDGEGAISEAVTLKVDKNKNGKLRLVIAVDDEWLQSSERVYPVTVDPGIIENVIENPQSTFISSTHPTTNYDSSNELYISNNDGVYGESYALYKLNFFESDLNADHVVSAVLNFTAITGITSQIRAKAYEVTSDWNASTVTWNNKPTTDERVIDVMGVEDSEVIPLEFTKLYAEWAKNPENNKGIMIKAMDEGTIVINSLATVPVLTLQYVSTTGLDETSSYSEFDMGTAGSVYINNLSGNLVVARDEIDSLGENYPYDLTSTYNSFPLTENRSNKWLMSYESGFLNEKQYIDSDGSIETFKVTPVEGEANSYTLDEPNLGFETVTVNSDSIDASCDSGSEKYTFNENGLVSYVVDIDTEQPNSGETVFSRENVTTDGFDIIDGDGKKLTVAKTTAQYSVTQYDGEAMGDRLVYTYNANGDVSSITLNGKTQAVFTYDSLGRMATIANDVGYTLTFTYEGNSNSISKVEESKNGVLGRTAAFQRGVTSTKITTSGADGVFGTTDDVVATYKFNNNAKLIGTYSKTVNGDDLGAVSLQYDNEKADIFGGISKISSVGINPENLLKNHNLEKVTSDWNTKAYADSSAVGSGSLKTGTGYLGENSLKVQVSDFSKNGAYGYYQKFNAADGVLTPGETYIASAYINTSGLTLAKDDDTTSSSSYGAFLMIELETASKTTRYYSSAITQTNSEADGGWERVYRSITLPSNFVSVSVGLVIRNAIGTAYFDCPQFELGKTPSVYNLVENNSFTYGESNWVRHNLDTTDGVINGEAAVGGVPGVKKGYYQEINLGEATQKDSFVMSAWVKASALPLKDGRFFAIYPIVFYKTASGGSVSESKSFIRFDYNDEEWQFVSAPVELKTDDNTLVPYKVRFYLCYYRQGNTAFFDNISLVRTSDVYDLTVEEEATEETDPNTYDEDGKILTYTDENGKVYTYTYDSFDNVTSILDPDENGDRFTYNYYDTDGDGIDDKSLIASETYEDGSSYTFEYNEAFKLTRQECVEDGVTSTYTYEYNTENELIKETYSSDSVIKTTTFDTEGRISSIVTNGKDENDDEYTNTVSYTYDNFNNIITVKENDVVTETYTYNYYDTNGDGIDDKSDLASETLSDGTQNAYTYYEYGKLRTQTTTKNGKSLTYNYDIEGNLTRVDHNGFSYNYEYDAFGNTTAVKVGEQSLINYNYLPDKSNIGSVTYGNGSTIGYTYNAYGEVTEMNRNGLGKTEYRYSNDGKPIYVNDAVSGRKTFNWYDVNGKLIGEKVLSTSESNIQDNFLYSSLNVYNDEGALQKNILSSAYRTLKTSYGYNSNDMLETLGITSTRIKTFSYDDENRLIGTSMSTETPMVDSYEYGDNGLISTHTVSCDGNNNVYTYSYDEKDNITEIKKNGVIQQSYVYDSDNQLIRENNLDINKTIVYNYDGYGNILSKTEYPYTTDTTITASATNVINYSYDTAWKDKLTSYNGESIAYDSIGNPTNYMGAEMSWFGRQLLSYETNDKEISYVYDEDGLRTQKLVNGVEHNYYYAGDLLSIEEIGDEYVLYYRYDDNGVLAAVSRYTVATGVTSFLNARTNTRGDVVALCNGNGEEIVKYSYDSWGKLISITNGDGETLGENTFGYMNSVRYRGYVYDQETGLYYLQSRYYDPETGRFLNADSVDYLGVSGTMLGYNAFAYCENNAVNCWDPSGFITYMFYYNKKDYDFKEQAKWMKKEYFNNKNVKLVGLKEWSEFKKAWNNLRNKTVDDIFLFMHGIPGALSFNGLQIYVKDMKSLKKIEKLKGKIYLLSCHGGTTPKEGKSVASFFATLQSGTKVRAVINGKVYYRAYNQIFDRKPLTKQEGAYWADFIYQYVDREKKKIVCIINRRSEWYYG